MALEPTKQLVYDFWQQASCGEELYLEGTDRAGYLAQARRRYELEPFITDFARFGDTFGLRVLEIGIGLGADHQRFAEAGADLFGIDLTERAVAHTRHRLSLFGLSSHLSTGDAENLSFPDESFDLVYSWGAIHHSPDTAKAVDEISRVLRSGGVARVMIYHKWSLVGYMLWFRYALLSLKPWTGLAEVYARYLESPGTKAYTISEAKQLFAKFREVEIWTELTHADLLESGAGQRHRGVLQSVARRIWPRRMLRRVAKGQGLFMLIRAVK